MGLPYVMINQNVRHITRYESLITISRQLCSASSRPSSQLRCQNTLKQIYCRRTHSEKRSFSTSQFLASSDSKEPLSETEYHLNIGAATDTLLRDLDNFASTGITDYSIYSTDIEFIEPNHTFIHLRGKTLYEYFSKCVKYALGWWLKDAKFTVVSVRQVRDEDDFDGGSGIGDGSRYGEERIVSNASLFSITDTTSPSPSLHSGLQTLHREPNVTSTSSSPLRHFNSTLHTQSSLSEIRRPIHLHVRWILEGIHRPSSALSNFNPLTFAASTSHSKSSYEGLFIYTFNDHGYICRHLVKNIVPAPKVPMLSWWTWWRLLSTRRTPVSVPAGFGVNIHGDGKGA